MVYMMTTLWIYAKSDLVISFAEQLNNLMPIVRNNTVEFIPDNVELTSLFIQIQDVIRNRHHPIYITHIREDNGY